MIIFGINDSSHDAALSVVRDGEVVFAGHSERYNKEKNTFKLCNELIEEALTYGEPDVVAYFEKRWKKRLRRKIFGGLNGEYKSLYSLVDETLKNITEVQVDHHFSHAAAGYFTSSFNDATIVVIDAIGEFACSTVWDGVGCSIKKRKTFGYPLSFGLFYSAFTHLLGLKPGTEEYILMGMAGFGDESRFRTKVNEYFPSIEYQPYSLHNGVPNWPHEVVTEQDKFDIAAAVQYVYEQRLLEFMDLAKMGGSSSNLVFMGGCALNCSANTKLLDRWENIWIMPNPGDAGSSLGAALALYGEHVDWTGPYLGHNIQGEYPVDKIISTLLRDGIVAVANGRAEFGPRALGNRSILADPRTIEMKDKVNSVKQREMFRPFAPVILEKDVSKWFDLPFASPYMQYAVKCKRPMEIPAVVHVDGTSRVQTVNRSQHAGLVSVLSKWGQLTGVPILLNTSLNIKNQPLLNDRHDATAWALDNPGVRLVL